MFTKHYVLMAEAGEADGSGGDAAKVAVDRGDDILPPSTIDDSKKAEEEAAAAAAAEAAAAAAAAEELAAKATGEKSRDDQGKFAKKDKDDNDKHIPKERFDEAVNKERVAREAAEARAAAAEARVKQEEESTDIKQVTAQIKEMNAAYSKLLIDGETDKAAALMDQIQEAMEYRAERRNATSMAEATNKAVEQVRWDSAVATLEATYPVLNPESDMYDQDLTDIVIAEQHRLMQTQNMAASKALSSAATKIMKKFVGSTVAAPESKGLAAAKTNSDRKAEQVAKNLDTAQKQPGSMQSAGKDTDKAGEKVLEAANITRAELDAMPESTKAKLRGDFI